MSQHNIKLQTVRSKLIHNNFSLSWHTWWIGSIWVYHNKTLDILFSHQAIHTVSNQKMWKHISGFKTPLIYDEFGLLYDSLFFLPWYNTQWQLGGSTHFIITIRRLAHDFLLCWEMHTESCWSPSQMSVILIQRGSQAKGDNANSMATNSESPKDSGYFRWEDNF